MPSNLHIKMDFINSNNITSVMDAAYQIQQFAGDDREHEWYIIHVYEDIGYVDCNVYSRDHSYDMFTRQLKDRVLELTFETKGCDKKMFFAAINCKYIATTLHELLTQPKQSPTMETSKQMGITEHVLSVSTVNRKAEVIESVTLSKESANFITVMAQSFLHELLLSVEPTRISDDMLTPMKDVRSILSSLQTSFTIETGVCISCIRVLEARVKMCSNKMINNTSVPDKVTKTTSDMYGYAGTVSIFGDQEKQVVTRYNSATRDVMSRLASELRNSLLFIQPYKF
jgi:hypothetical protein